MNKIYKIQVIILFVLLPAIHTQALELKLKKIETSGSVIQDYWPSCYEKRMSPWASSYLHFVLTGFRKGEKVIQLDQNIKIICDGWTKAKRNRQEKYLSGTSYLNFSRTPKHIEKIHISSYFNKAFDYKTKVLKISGEFKVYMGKVKLLRVKISELDKHLNDLKADGIDLSIIKKTRSPVFKVKAKMGKIKTFFIGCDEGSKKTTWFGQPPGLPKNVLMVPKRFLKKDDAYFVLMYVKHVHIEKISLNFEVPLKWKEIRLPKGNNLKLVPVK